MGSPLARLRTDLEFMPSPVTARPGLLICDPYHYSDATLIIPPALVECLRCFDGNSSDLDLREVLVRLTGDLRVGELERHLVGTLSEAGFLEDETYKAKKAARHQAFADASVRSASHAGSGYPDAPAELRATLAGYLDGDAPIAPAGPLVGIAAPHVSLEGGRECYRAAYGALGAEYRDCVFVILGTSHFGEPDRFGLTRKPFSTPLGEAATEVALVDQLAERAGDTVRMEDYCHSFEHSIEFQVILLQHLYGPRVRILPILCGSFARALFAGERPEEDAGVRRFIDALGELAAREGERLFWVLGIDLAHMGRRYGDPFPAEADRGAMVQVAERDRARIDRISQGDAPGFWELLRGDHDDLKWCGAAPLYTFLKALPRARARLGLYRQWNIDAESVVSFAALLFHG